MAEHGTRESYIVPSCRSLLCCACGKQAALWGGRGDGHEVLIGHFCLLPMIVLNHLAITMLLGAPWLKTLTCLDFPLTTLTGSFEVAAELMGLEGLELEMCLSWWHADVAQLLLWKDTQARIGNCTCVNISIISSPVSLFIFDSILRARAGSRDCCLIWWWWLY